MTSFDDEGRYLVELTDRVDVRCPRCAGRAVATRPHGDRPARVVCSACPYAASFDESGWLGPMRGRVRCRCERCGQWIERRFTGPRPPRSTRVTCACGWQFDVAVTLEREVTRPVDPTFGLALWFTAPFRGEVVWAYNDRHLRFLRAFIDADRRERVPNRNSSLASRLPRWMKVAKNREGLVAIIDDLLARADDLRAD